MTSLEKKTVLLVDNLPDDIQLLSEFLQQDYTVLAAATGEEALKQVKHAPRPDVILLEAMMPYMNGYEVCRKLKEDPETRGIDVIFLSAHDSIEEKLAGYGAGGSDYLIKPVQPAELLQKVKLAINNKEIRDSHAAEKSVAMQTAMTAMTSAGEQGVVLEFLRHCTNLNTLDELAKEITESISQYGLDNRVQIRSGSGVINYGNEGAVSPLEHELLLRLNEHGRIMELDSLALFNFGLVSLFIKNMPEDDEKRGRIRDHIAILIQGAESKALALDTEESSAQSIADLNQVILDSKQALSAIIKAQKYHKLAIQQIMDNMLEKLTASTRSLRMTEKQKDRLIHVVQDGVNLSIEHLEQGLTIDENMRDVIKRLAEFK